MCFKKPNFIFTEPFDFRLISATINDYPGSMNDLRGCNNDGRLVKDTVLSYKYNADVLRLIDSQATVSAVTNAISSAISLLKPGAIVCILADSCFSGDITRLMMNFMGSIPTPENYKRNRFYQTPGVVPTVNYPLFHKSGDIRWIAMGGCGKVAYSADAYINGDYYGAFTYYAMNSLRFDMTYRQWYEAIKKYLPSSLFEQDPTFMGPDDLLDSIIGYRQTLWIHNSSHGTQLNGTNGDSVDEAICLYDGNLRDKVYYNILNKLK
jgi:hypothetical protein